MPSCALIRSRPGVLGQGDAARAAGRASGAAQPWRGLRQRAGSQPRDLAGHDSFVTHTGTELRHRTTFRFSGLA